MQSDEVQLAMKPSECLSVSNPSLRRYWPLMPAPSGGCSGSNSPAQRDLRPQRVLLVRDES